MTAADLTRQAGTATLYGLVRETLASRIPNVNLAAFGPAARLNEDLALDSIMLLQLFVFLEMDHGLAVPEDAVVGETLTTVADLVQLLVRCDGSAA